MKFICPTCNQPMPRDLLVIIAHTDHHIVEAIKKDHPDWVENNGICKRCYEYFKSQLHPKES